MNNQNWLSEWTARNRSIPMGADLVKSVMAAVTAPPRKQPLTASFIVWVSTRASQLATIFRSRPALLATGALGGSLRVAAFLYVLLFA